MSASNSPAGGPSTNSSPNTAGPGLPGGDEGRNVERIRDILFGDQMREYAATFSRLEERLQAEANELRADLQRRLASLEAFTKAELSSLSEQLGAEKEERLQAVKALGGELKEHVKAWEKKNLQFEAQNDKAHRELREQVLAEANRLGEEIRQKAKEWAASLAKESQELRRTATPRQQLSEILAQMALQLRNEGNEKREK